MDPKLLLFPLFSRKIKDLLAEYPQLTTFFMKHHTACIGCGFSSFCDLRDAMKFYDLDTGFVMEEIRRLTRTAVQVN